MVTTIRIPNTEKVALVISPYEPMSFRASVLSVSLICTPILAVAVVSGLLGNWYALPASTAVCIVVVLAFRSGYRRMQCREIVTLVDGSVSIVRGHSHPESRYMLPQDHTYVLLQESVPDAREHLYLCTDDHKVEIGELLDRKERHELADKLHDLVRATGNLGPMVSA